MNEIEGVGVVLQTPWARGEDLQVVREHYWACRHTLHLLNPRPKEQSGDHHRQGIPLRDACRVFVGFPEASGKNVADNGFLQELLARL